MVYISYGLNQEFTIGLLEETTEKDISFEHEGEMGVKLAFHVDTKDLGKACAIVKKAIKATPIDSVIYSRVAAE